MMWWISLFLFEDASGQAARVRAQMAESLAKQRVSVQQQIKATSAYRTVPLALAGSWPLRRHVCLRPYRGAGIRKDDRPRRQDHQVSPDLVREVAREESGFRPCAVSREQAQPD